jgi:CheY-like chemotaxis protein
MGTARGPLILLVEDDDDTRSSIRELLEEHGYRVAQCTDGRQAESYLRGNPPPACILLDLMLPQLDGWAVAALMRQGRLPKVPAIVMTAAGDRWGYPAAPELVLKKPLDMDKLLATVQTVAGQP